MTAPSLSTKDLRRVVIAAAVGNVIEWYDFYIFGSLAALLSVKFFAAGAAGSALIKTVGTLSGWILLAAQTGQAAAAEGFLPRALMRQDARGVPVLALLVSSSFTCLVAMATKSATLSQQFVRLVELSVLLSLSVYAVALAALLKRDAAAGDRKDVLYRSCALLGIVFCAYVIGSSTAFVLWTLAALVLVTMVIYAVAMRGAPRPVSG